MNIYIYIRSHNNRSSSKTDRPLTQDAGQTLRNCVLEQVMELLFSRFLAFSKRPRRGDDYLLLIYIYFFFFFGGGVYRLLMQILVYVCCCC